MDLYDLNLLFALVADDHPHHSSVLSWKGNRDGYAFATCSVTEFGLIRLLMNARLSKNSVNGIMAVNLIKEIHSNPLHSYLDRLPSVTASGFDEVLQGVRGYRQVTDAYLIALAKTNGCKLATLDRKLLDIFGDEYLELVPTN